YDVLEGADEGPVTTRAQPGTFRSRSGDRYGWLTLRTAWSPALWAESTLSYGDLSATRTGSSSDVTEVSDARDTTIVGLKQWLTWVAARQTLKWCFDVKRLRARYRYQATFTDPSAAARDVEAEPGGTERGVYVSDQLRLGARWRAELGLRWD